MDKATESTVQPCQTMRAQGLFEIMDFLGSVWSRFPSVRERRLPKSRTVGCLVVMVQDLAAGDLISYLPVFLGARGSDSPPSTGWKEVIDLEV